MRNISRLPKINETILNVLANEFVYYFSYVLVVSFQMQQMENVQIVGRLGNCIDEIGTCCRYFLADDSEDLGSEGYIQVVEVR